MTAREMEKEFQTAANFIDKVKNDEIVLLTDDTEYFLNEAQHVFINTRLRNIKQKTSDKQKDLDELRTLLVKGTTLVQDVGDSTNEYQTYDLPANYHYLISDYSNTVFCSVTRRVQNRLVDAEELQEILWGTHTKSSYKSPVSELFGNKLRVYRDKSLTFTINDVIIDYIRDWQLISVINSQDCELDESVHKDIVQLAVNIFLEAIESGRFPTNIEKNVLTQQV